MWMILGRISLECRPKAAHGFGIPLNELWSASIVA
jgi:hypothetical protein